MTRNVIVNVMTIATVAIARMTSVIAMSVIVMIAIIWRLCAHHVVSKSASTTKSTHRI